MLKFNHTNTTSTEAQSSIANKKLSMQYFMHKQSFRQPPKPANKKLPVKKNQTYQSKTSVCEMH